jgi:hypothetical protein
MELVELDLKIMINSKYGQFKDSKIPLSYNNKCIIYVKITANYTLFFGLYKKESIHGKMLNK